MYISSSNWKTGGQSFYFMMLITCVESSLLVSVFCMSLPSKSIVNVHNAVNQDVHSAKSIRNQLLPLWKKVLLNQFHDVLPGSCIQQVMNHVHTFFLLHMY